MKLLVRDRILLYDSTKGETGEKDFRVRTDTSLIKAEIRGSGTLVIQGTTDIPDEDGHAYYFTIGGISVTDYSKHVSLTNGMFNVECSGLCHIKTSLDSACDVYLTLIG